jgi:hypothetical protein
MYVTSPIQSVPAISLEWKIAGRTIYSRLYLSIGTFARSTQIIQFTSFAMLIYFRALHYMTLLKTQYLQQNPQSYTTLYQPCCLPIASFQNTMSKLLQIKQGTSRSRLCRERKKNGFFSKKIFYKTDERTIAPLLRKCAWIIWNHYFYDDLKAPMHNPAKSAIASAPSFNIYFGDNLEKKDDVLLRTAYATGSGTSSIGLNPETMRFYACFPELQELKAKISALTLKDESWQRALNNQPFNFVSVKIYWTFRDKNGSLVRKITNWHVDIETTPSGVPKKSNSQEPGTPVAILTFGDEKSLYFRRQQNKTTFNNDTIMEIRQRNGDLFVLDGRDEIVNDAWPWRHMSKAAPDPSSITYAFMFRRVRATVEVKQTDHRLANPPKLPLWKQQQFLDGEAIFDTNHYKVTRQQLTEQMNNFFKEH